MHLSYRLPWGLMIVGLVILTVIGSVAGAYLALYVLDQRTTVQAAPLIEAPSTPVAASSVSPPPIPGSAFHPKYLKSDPPLIREAKRYLGVPYLFGGEYGRDGAVDCSSYTQLVFASIGITLPRTTYGQVEIGELVERANLAVGDLIFFENTSYLQNGVTHVGIYTGNGEFIHAAGSIGQVAITPLSDPFYSSHYHSARRVSW